MSNVCIQVPFACPYPNEELVSIAPVFVLGPDPSAWGEWLFGGDASSFVDQSHGRSLQISGSPPGSPVFTDDSYVSFPYPNGLIAPGFADSTSQTLIVAFKREPGVTKYLMGSAVIGTGGSGVLSLASNSIQFFKSVSGATQTATVPGAEVDAISGDMLIVALVDDGEETRGYVHGASTTVTITGTKTLQSNPSVGNASFNSSNYLNSPAYRGARFYNRVLSESEVRESMEQLRRRISARPTS